MHSTLICGLVVLVMLAILHDICLFKMHFQFTMRRELTPHSGLISCLNQTFCLPSSQRSIFVRLLLLQVIPAIVTMFINGLATSQRSGKCWVGDARYL